MRIATGAGEQTRVPGMVSPPMVTGPTRPDGRMRNPRISKRLTPRMSTAGRLSVGGGVSTAWNEDSVAR